MHSSVKTHNFLGGFAREFLRENENKTRKFFQLNICPRKKRTSGKIQLVLKPPG